MTKHTRDQKSWETRPKKIPCVQPREYIHRKDFFCTLLLHWLFKVREMPAPGEVVEESVVIASSASLLDAV